MEKVYRFFDANKDAAEGLLEIAGNPPLGLEIEGEIGVGALHGAALAAENRTTLLVINRSEDPVPVALELAPGAPGRTRLSLNRYEAKASCPALARVRLDSEDRPWEQGPCAPHSESRKLVRDVGGVTLAPYSLSVVSIESP